MRKNKGSGSLAAALLGLALLLSGCAREAAFTAGASGTPSPSSALSSAADKDGEAPRPGWKLFEDLFLAAAEGDVETDWESFSQALEEQGYAYTKDEGCFSAEDPEHPGSHLDGFLTNKDGVVELSALTYTCADSGEEHIVMTDFSGDGPRYLVDVDMYAPEGFESSGVQVDSPVLMEDYIRFGYLN